MSVLQNQSCFQQVALHVKIVLDNLKKENKLQFYFKERKETNQKSVKTS